MDVTPYDMARNMLLHAVGAKSLRPSYPFEMSSIWREFPHLPASCGRREKSRQLEGILTTFIRRSDSGLPEADVRPYVDQSPMAQTGARGAISRSAGLIVACHSGDGLIA